MWSISGNFATYTKEEEWWYLEEEEEEDEVPLSWFKLIQQQNHISRLWNQKMKYKNMSQLIKNAPLKIQYPKRTCTRKFEGIKNWKIANQKNISRNIVN